MKYISLFILLFNIGMAQDSSPIRIDSAPVYLEDDSLTTPPQYIDLKTLLSWYEEYKVECYNDSMEVFKKEGGVPHFCTVMGCTQQWDVAPTNVSVGWHHKDGTIPFLEYLKRKQ